MLRITKFLCVPALAVAMVVAGDTSKADAGGFSISIGSGGFGGYGVPGYRYSSGYGGYGRGAYGYGLNNGYRAYGPTVYPGVSSRYRSGYRGYPQSRFQYRAPGSVPYRGRSLYQSGRYGLPYGRYGLPYGR